MDHDAPAIPAWDPARTRAFIVCLARFEGEAADAPSFSLADRLDVPFVQLLEGLGVPPANIAFLMDDGATTEAVHAAFPPFLANANPDDMLLFYYGSHGALADDTRAFYFSSYDGHVTADWLYETIEANFPGRRALLFADSCHSGGLAVAAQARPASPVAYAVLGSTFVNQVAWSRWRFLDCLGRGFGGEAVCDLDGDGAVGLAELAHFTARRMAFVAEGRPTFWAHPDFGPLKLAEVAQPRKDARVGAYVEVESGGSWYRAEVLDVEGERLYVHYTDYPTSDDAWVAPERARLPRYPHLPPGSAVELKASGSGTWHPGHVLATWEGLHLGRYDGHDAAADEWFGPSRIRARG